MPLYEYRCTACSHVFEVSHEVGGRPGPCPVCGGGGRRIFTSVGLIFKGSGFHTTDYRRTASGPNGAAAKDGAPAEGGTTATGATESAPRVSTGTEAASKES
jgi:putative FmdB family regulatory protein